MPPLPSTAPPMLARPWAVLAAHFFVGGWVSLPTLSLHRSGHGAAESHLIAHGTRQMAQAQMVLKNAPTIPWFNPFGIVCYSTPIPQIAAYGYSYLTRRKSRQRYVKILLLFKALNISVLGTNLCLFGFSPKTLITN